MLLGPPVRAADRDVPCPLYPAQPARFEDFGESAGAGIAAADLLQDEPQKPEPVPQPVRPPGRRRFLTAASEVALFEAIPWAFGRYIGRYDFSYISMDTVRENFRRGFGFDPDTFEVNQSSHPYHGGLYFNSARENGYGLLGIRRVHPGGKRHLGVVHGEHPPLHERPGEHHPRRHDAR